MLKVPFYDPAKTYEQNYSKGPFGAFINGRPFNFAQGEPQYDFLGQKVYLPFGIPAGPLINSNFCRGAFEKGFDICVYKTVRSSFFPCHPFPNILSVKIKGDLTLEKAQQKLVADQNFKEPISITNSFGVPSKNPEVWQEDVKKAISYAGKGQVLVLSFMGTVSENQNEREFLDDWRKVVKLSFETGAKIFEANLSCPNIGNEGLVCYNLKMTEKVCQVIREEIKNKPLILKVGFYQKDRDIQKLVEICGKYAQAVASINTIQAEIVDKNGNQALPGKMRLRSGVCGAAILWAGLDMVKRLAKERKRQGIDFKIVGVGGVVDPDDYLKYIKEGADCVMSATGVMWNPYLASQIKQKYGQKTFWQTN